MSKPWEIDRYDAKANYDFMRQHFHRCWACFSNSKPKNYLGPWLIERAHIVNKPRREDRRLVVMLCTICHKANHGERIAGNIRPRLTTSMMIQIKKEFDPLWFDLEFMGKHSVRMLYEPETDMLPDEYKQLRDFHKPTRKKR